MKTKMKILALSMGVLLALACCAPVETTGEKPVTGRYVEDALPLPQTLRTLHYLDVLSDGGLVLVGAEADGPAQAWVSVDGGESWAKRDFPWLDTLRAYNVGELALDSGDALWFTHEEEEPGEMEWDSDGPLPEPLVRVGEDGLHRFPGTLQNHMGNNAQSLVIGDGCVAVSYGDIAVYDMAGTELLYVDADSYLQPGDYLLDGRRLAVSDGGAIAVYDLETGRRSGELAVQGGGVQYEKTDFFDYSTNRTVIANTGEPGVLAYCNGSGIYRISLDGALHEKVLPGERSSLMMPTVSLQKLLVQGDVYYAYVTDKDSMPWQLSGAMLLRYRYDESVPVTPTSELRVFSLGDAPTIRQAAGIFQRENPEIRVRLEVPEADTGAAGVEDALRGLSVELLSGAGPDVLVLDDLPLDSYRQKGVLLDLGGALPAGLQADILPGLLGSHGSDGAVYAIPARFSLAMILGDAAIIRQVGELHGLAAYVDGLDSPQLGLHPDALYDTLYPLFHGAWFRGDSAMDEEAASQGLADMARLLRRYEGMDHTRLWDAQHDARVGAIGWIAGWTPFYLDRLTSIEQLAGPYTAVREKGGVYIPYPSAEEASLQPHTVVGVNAASGRGETAVEFLACVLSQQVQSVALGDGLPVNRQALTAMQQSGEADYGRFGVSFFDEFADGAEKGLTIPLYRPDQAFFDEFNSYIENARCDGLVDGNKKRIILQEAEAYFSGRVPLEETTASLKKKLDIYQAE